MVKLVKLTSNIDHDLLESQLPCLTSDPETCEGELTFLFYSEHFGVLKVKIGQEMAKLVKLTSNIDLDLLAAVFDL